MVVDNESPPRRYKPVQINESDALYGNFRKQSEFQQNEQQSGSTTSTTNVNEKISPTPSRSTLQMSNTSNKGHSTNDGKTNVNPSIQDVK